MILFALKEMISSLLSSAFSRRRVSAFLRLDICFSGEIALLVIRD